MIIFLKVLFKVLVFPFVVVWRLIVNVIKFLFFAQFLMTLLTLLAVAAGVYYLDHLGVISIRGLLGSIK